ncbi:tetratricopeptide repeat protein [Desulfogranum japonicum]|uniref:tetratricopeptide repeat protein n=1 Tax=Desulfogranum japonicum TaxID=231447 RepID=UPI000413DA14|nr:tetratricopeptide repeat protein [Desulfogranum japonicum]
MNNAILIALGVVGVIVLLVLVKLLSGKKKKPAGPEKVGEQEQEKAPLETPADKLVEEPESETGAIPEQAATDVDLSEELAELGEGFVAEEATAPGEEEQAQEPEPTELDVETGAEEIVVELDEDILLEGEVPESELEVVAEEQPVEPQEELFAEEELLETEGVLEEEQPIVSDDVIPSAVEDETTTLLEEEELLEPETQEEIFLEEELVQVDAETVVEDLVEAEQLQESDISEPALEEQLSDELEEEETVISEVEETEIFAEEVAVEPEPEEAVVEEEAEPETAILEEDTSALLAEGDLSEDDLLDLEIDQEYEAPASIVQDEDPLAALLGEEEPELEEELAEVEEEPLAAGTQLISYKQYSDRLNALEEQLRADLENAHQGEGGNVPAHLQRELVVVNEKLAMLDESYAKEKETYQEVLAVLQDMGSEVAGADIQEASEALKSGNPDVAETLLAKVALQATGKAKALGAYYSGKLAECRIDLPLAMERYKHAIEIAGDNPEYLSTAAMVARQLYLYGNAVAWMESAVEELQKKAEIDPVELAVKKRDLAYTYVLSGRSQLAGPLYKEAMTVFSQQLGQDHPEMATSWYQIGELQETIGEYDKAISLYRKALEILEKQYGEEHPVLASVLSKLAALCVELEMERESVPLYERLVTIREKTLRPTHPMVAMSLNSMAESYRLQGMHDMAEGCYQKCLVIAEETLGPEHPRVGAILQELAKACQSQRKGEEAEEYQKRATAIFAKAVEEQERKSADNSFSLEL